MKEFNLRMIREWLRKNHKRTEIELSVDTQTQTLMVGYDKKVSEDTNFGEEVF